ncbi:MAG: LysM peptidoglycan-binding domain-containing protein [Bacteroidota bacterium]|nr:LysM peptidoglycan-binding domain-containing protein [Bacteroidota bacterium]
MITNGFGNFEKLRIESYEDAAFKTQAKKVDGVFTALINPDSYTTREKVEFCDTQAPGRSKPILKFNKMPAQEMNFDFLFDGTGVVNAASALSIGIANPLAKSKTVTDQIEDYKKRVFKYEGEVHKPYYLKIIWGTFLLKCVLTSIDIEYKLFNTDGAPVRAIVKCGFKEIIDEALLSRTEDRASPDVTHQRIMKASDRLDLMTYNIYNNQQYISQVASFNKLDGFRSVAAGTVLYFPSLQK